MDMTAGIFARFRTMAIARASVLTGHVLGSVIQSVLGMASSWSSPSLLGFRPAASARRLARAARLRDAGRLRAHLADGRDRASASRRVEAASNSPMFLVILPFLSSGFVPTESMPTWLGWFAEHQPFTPMIETTRGLLAGTPDGSTALLAVGWCVAIALAGYLWAPGALPPRSVELTGLDEEQVRQNYRLADCCCDSPRSNVTSPGAVGLSAFDRPREPLMSRRPRTLARALLVALLSVAMAVLGLGSMPAAQAAPKAQISGRVTDEEGHPIGGIFIDVLEVTDDGPPFDSPGGTTTAANGTYRFPFTPAGTTRRVHRPRRHLRERVLRRPAQHLRRRPRDRDRRAAPRASTPSWRSVATCQAP